MSTIAISDPSSEKPFLARAWTRTGALRAAVIAGALSGALIAGGGGRIAMRIVALVDASRDGVRTEFGATAGEITLGGTFTLIMLMTIAGVMGGLLYTAMRRWLPGRGIARAAAFGLVIALGPGRIAVGEIDLQIFEPAVPLLLMFAAVEFAYGVAVALIADRLHPEPPRVAARRADMAARVVTVVAAVGMCALAVAIIFNTIDNAGTCLTAAEGGGCGLRTEATR